MAKAIWRQVLPLTWTHALAFGGATVDRLRGAADLDRTDSVSLPIKLARRTVALLMLATSFLLVLSGQLRHTLHAGSDSRSLVIIQRHDGGGYLKVGVITIAAALLFSLLASGLALLISIWMRSAKVFEVLGSIETVGMWTLGAWVLVGVVVSLIGSLGRGVSISPIGEMTPPGERWIVQSLAARSALDGPAALLLAYRTLQSFPPGRVLVAVARTKKLLEHYVKLGFSDGLNRRVYKIT